MKEELSAHASSTVIIQPSESATISPGFDADRIKEGAGSADTSNGTEPNLSHTAVSKGFHPAVNGSTETHAEAKVDGTSHEGQRASSDVGPRSADLKSTKDWNLRSNPALFRLVNPIRKLTEAISLNKDTRKDLITLAAGDPATFGPHMKVPEVANSSLIKVIQDGRHNGYSISFGLLECRSALADYLSQDAPYNLKSQEVVMTVGAAQALHVTINGLSFSGCNILLPRPGFPLYQALCSYYGAEPRYYDLLEDRNSEVDLDQVAAIADENTAAMLVCNPGNPSGAVFSYEHLTKIANVAGELKVPIISDEVYSSLVFGKNPFVSMSKFSSLVPVLAIGGISKGWLATGWRLGWIGIWDPNEILKNAKILEAMMNIMQITSGPSTPIQAAVPHMLKSTPASFYEETCESLRSGADLCYTRANKIQGLSVPSRPEGSMFMMVKLDLPIFKSIKSDMEFSKELLREESVLVLPGVGFGRPSWFRLVFALSVSRLAEAWDRIEAFCSRHVQ